MKIHRVYVDTSVIGGRFDPEFAVWSNGLMRDFQLGIFRAVVSEVVAAEIRIAREPVRRKYAELLALEAEFLRVSDETLDLLDAYQERGILGASFGNEMLHIALATVAEVDVLVSRNFRHIVHLEKIRMFNAVNIEVGYKPLQIYSPREVTTRGENQNRSASATDSRCSI